MGIKIPKANGGERLLGIPTVQDRIIQQAVQQTLTMKFDREFSQHSYAYRESHSAHQAVQMARSYVEQGKDWVVDLDISAFFDEVNHDILLHQISRKIEDKQVLDLIRRYLKTGIMMDGKIARREKGTPHLFLLAVIKLRSHPIRFPTSLRRLRRIERSVLRLIYLTDVTQLVIFAILLGLQPLKKKIADRLAAKAVFAGLQTPVLDAMHKSADVLFATRRVVSRYPGVERRITVQ